MEHLKRPAFLSASIGAAVVLGLGALGCSNDPCKDNPLITAEEGTEEYEEQCQGFKEARDALEEIAEEQRSN